VALRRLRNGNGLSTTDVARAVRMSQSKISRMENAEIGCYLDDLGTLFDFYRVPEPRRDELLAWARRAEERGQVQPVNPLLPVDWRAWLDFEDEATSVRGYQPLMIPGLLQTPEYASAVIRATAPGLADHQVDEMVASRMARQGRLSRSRPVRLDAIIEEDVLFRPFGQAGALYRQLRHLVDSASRRTITVRLIRRDVELHAGLTGSFVILDYDDEPSLVLLENKVASQFLDDEAQVAAYVESWAALAELACSEDESADLINDMISSMG
jgi:transcriptional regulator with XRE-family HTH domain